jgi:hypothetical protein
VQGPAGSVHSATGIPARQEMTDEDCDKASADARHYFERDD